MTRRGGGSKGAVAVLVGLVTSTKCGAGLAVPRCEWSDTSRGRAKAHRFRQRFLPSVPPLPIPVVNWKLIDRSCDVDKPVAALLTVTVTEYLHAANTCRHGTPVNTHGESSRQTRCADCSTSGDRGGGGSGVTRLLTSGQASMRLPSGSARSMGRQSVIQVRTSTACSLTWRSWHST